MLGFWLLVAVGAAVPGASADNIAAPDSAPAASPALSTFNNSSPIDSGSGTSIAQSTDQTSGQLPIELAPVKLPERRTATETMSAFQSGLLYHLPGRVFFNCNTENSLRLETNVFQTAHHQRTDMVYRPLPNVTLGYALTRRTRVSANYFFLRDQYTRNDQPLSRNIQSVGGRIDQDIPITSKTTATVGLMDRLLFVSHSRWLNDLLPSVAISRPVGYRGFVYGSVIGQLRFFDVFKGLQEGDQFYSVGGVYRNGPWILSADNTFISSFRKRRIAGPTSEAFILTFEAARRVLPKIPVPLYAFVRAQPIFNIGANQVTGFAGFNFRLFGGIRIDINKPALFPVKLARL